MSVYVRLGSQPWFERHSLLDPLPEPAFIVIFRRWIEKVDHSRRSSSSTCAESRKGPWCPCRTSSKDSAWTTGDTRARCPCRPEPGQPPTLRRGGAGAVPVRAGQGQRARRPPPGRRVGSRPGLAGARPAGRSRSGGPGRGSGLPGAGVAAERAAGGRGAGFEGPAGVPPQRRPASRGADDHGRVTRRPRSRIPVTHIPAGQDLRTGAHRDSEPSHTPPPTRPETCSSPDVVPGTPMLGGGSRRRVTDDLGTSGQA